MPKKRSFLLTIFPSEEKQSSLHGRIQVIATGATHTFSSLEELQHFINNDLRSASYQQADCDTHLTHAAPLPGLVYPDFSEEALNNPANIPDDTSFSM